MLKKDERLLTMIMGATAILTTLWQMAANEPTSVDGSLIEQFSPPTALTPEQIEHYNQFSPDQINELDWTIEMGWGDCLENEDPVSLSPTGKECFVLVQVPKAPQP